MRKYVRMEIWVTVLCLIVAATTGAFLSVFFIIFNNAFFDQVPPPEHLAHVFETMFVPKQTVLGYPLHFFLLIVLSWIGITIVAAIWSLVMDNVERKQIL